MASRGRIVTRMKIALINSPSPFLEEMDIQPPLGLLYVASMFEKHGQEVTVLDYGVRDYGIPEGYDMYGFSATTPQYFNSLDLAKKIDGYKIIGGPHVTAVNEYDNLWNVIVKGEGETIIPLLLKKYGDQKIIKSEIVKDLDSIPFPARHLVNLDDYVRTLNGEKCTSIITSRGCPFNCSFCGKSMSGKLYRRRSVENVMAEIDHLIKEYGYKAFLFVDDSFTLKRNWILKFCREMKKREVIWRCWTRVDIVDFEMLKVMSESGCVETGFGIESGSDKILKAMNKGTTVKQGLKAIEWTKKAGMKAKIFLIGAFPLETEESLVETLNFINKTNPDTWGLGTCVPLPDSSMYRNPKKYGIKEISSNFNRFYMVGRGGKGAISFIPSETTVERLVTLRNVLLEYLRSRGGVK